MVKTPLLQASAHAWAARTFPGNASYGSPGPFLAVHIRPYMDECLDIWKRRVFNASAATSRICAMPGLHSGIARAAKQQMQKHGLPGNKVRVRYRLQAHAWRSQTRLPDQSMVD